MWYNTYYRQCSAHRDGRHTAQFSSVAHFECQLLYIPFNDDGDNIKCFVFASACDDKMTNNGAFSRTCFNSSIALLFCCQMNLYLFKKPFSISINGHFIARLKFILKMCLRLWLRLLFKVNGLIKRKETSRNSWKNAKRIKFSFWFNKKNSQLIAYKMTKNEHKALAEKIKKIR